MEAHAWSGLLLIVLAGLFSGSFSVPFKFNTTWQWENNWLVWSVAGLILVPWVVALATVPHLGEVYGAESGSLGLVFLFGLIWGVGAILFGLGIDTLGIALSMPIMLGLNNALGSIIPILLRNPAELAAPAGIRLLCGIVVILLGIVLYSVAGSRKERESHPARHLSEGNNGSDAGSGSNAGNGIAGNKGADHAGVAVPAGAVPRRTFVAGLVICILAGVLGPMINFSFVYGAPIQTRAVELGAQAMFASNAVWSITATGGCIVNIGYCLYLLRKRGTGAAYRTGRPANWLLAAAAGVIWFISIMLYGMGSNYMGASGTSVGWALMQTLAILTGNLAGIFTGEWKHAGRNTRAIMYGGLSLLLVGVVVIAFRG